MGPFNRSREDELQEFDEDLTDAQWIAIWKAREKREVQKEMRRQDLWHTVQSNVWSTTIIGVAIYFIGLVMLGVIDHLKALLKP